MLNPHSIAKIKDQKWPSLLPQGEGHVTTWNTYQFLKWSNYFISHYPMFLSIVLFTLYPIRLLFVHYVKIHALCCKLFFFVILGFNIVFLSKITQRKLTAVPGL